MLSSFMIRNGKEFATLIKGDSVLERLEGTYFFASNIEVFVEMETSYPSSYPSNLKSSVTTINPGALSGAIGGAAAAAAAAAASIASRSDSESDSGPVEESNQNEGHQECDERQEERSERQKKDNEVEVEAEYDGGDGIERKLCIVLNTNVGDIFKVHANMIIACHKIQRRVMSIEREAWIKVALTKTEEILNDTILGERNVSKNQML